SFIDDGLLARHIRRMRRTYAERHDRIVDILNREFGGTITPLPSAGGLHLSAMCNSLDGCGDLALAQCARARGVELLPLSYHYVDSQPQPGLLFGYGAIPTNEIAEGLSLLRTCLP